MNKYQKLSRAFGIAAVLLSFASCAYTLCLYFSALYAEINGTAFTSAPAWVAFYFLIPFAFPVALCVILHLIFKKKA